jgi:hypothetical protein
MKTMCSQTERRHGQWAGLILAVVLAGVLGVARANAEIRLGDPVEKVRQELGEPSARMQSGGLEIMLFDRTRVEVRNGKVVGLRLVSQDEPARVDAEASEAKLAELSARAAEAEREAKIAELERRIRRAEEEVRAARDAAQAVQIVQPVVPAVTHTYSVYQTVPVYQAMPIYQPVVYAPSCAWDSSPSWSVGIAWNSGYRRAYAPACAPAYAPAWCPPARAYAPCYPARPAHLYHSDNALAVRF